MYCDLCERSAILNELLDMLKHPKAPRDLTIYSLIEVKKGDRAVKALSKRLDEEVEALSKRMDEKGQSSVGRDGQCGHRIVATREYYDLFCANS